ncbi:MAG: alkyl hydroperoxide reductase [Sphingomonas bacterium]|uniref:redoxin family protein n=1 Tax=Sphingomonas bacterium TaxID=1895847 RepID=UPI002611D8F2|nr:redoxin family protein [Sphingomonas bacterium]MDB5712225.1 alkyl hydroperoxide reductase [Sphingomonas bacterium]
MRRWLLWLPFVAFVLLFAVVTFGLKAPADRTIKSAMVGKPLPDFALAGIVPGKPGLSSGDFAPGKPRLLNVFASWCLPCIAEAPQLMALKQAGVEIDAVAVRDTTPALQEFLARNGDPYARIGDDKQSRVQLSIGSSGVPETFLIDAQGKIIEQHIGDIRADEVPDILAKLRAAQ